ncbi:MAG: SDR family oxidoreductase [Alphaproteobacteria bacterium]|nr:SDR family oxidoreductase [Alphaproteobacteria bacterium]MDE2513078.1 SDR family oxidoreductase [Alphaproteobacteria bacterium]
MDLQLKGRTALVTGASMGIGRAIAAGLAAEGARLAIVARRKDLLEQVAAGIEKSGGVRPAVIVADVMQPESPQRICDEAVRALGKIEILVNSAGGSRPLPADAPDQSWDEALTLNFTRLRQLTHAILPGMIVQKWGRIINITGKSEPERINASFAAKAAVHAWAKGLSREIGKHGITINSIAPGRIITEQILRLYPEEERRKFAAREIPVGEYGQPEDLAVLAVFLASPLARYMTGTVIPVDGGLRRYQF